MTEDQDEPAIQSSPANPDRRGPKFVGLLTIGIDWDWDEARGKLIDNRTGLDLIVDGKPNEAIRNAPDRPGYVKPEWRDPDADWVDDKS